MAPHEVKRLEAERDGLFLEIVQIEAHDPRLTVAQLRFLIENLPAMMHDEEAMRLVHSACGGHLDSLAAMAAASLGLGD